jgi:hypothetical protein
MAAIILTAFVTAALYNGSEAHAQANMTKPNMTSAGANMTKPNMTSAGANMTKNATK